MGRRRRQNDTVQQQPATAKPSAQLCTHFAKGHCRFGDGCRFFHSRPDEAQDAAADAGGPTAKLEEMITVAELVSEVTPEVKRLRQELQASEQARAELKQEAAAKGEQLRCQSERAGAVQAECDQLKQQLEKLRVEWRASERGQLRRACVEARLQQEAAAKGEELRRVSERANAAQAECDELKQQLERLRVESRASELAKARLQQQAVAKGEELRRASERADAAQAECDKLKQQLKEASVRPAGASSGQPSGQAGFCAAEWCFESRPGEWTSLPASSSADLLRSYQELSKGREAVVHLRSGVDEYKFDFKAMSQTNKRTGKSRSIKCQLHVPSNWTRCTSLESLGESSDAESFELSGFGYPCLDGTYVLSRFHQLGERKVWWHVFGHAIMYMIQSTVYLLAIGGDYADDLAKIAQGGVVRKAECRGASSPRFAKTGWLVSDHTGVLKKCETAQVSSPGRRKISRLMELAVEFSDEATLEEFAKLFRGSTAHQKQHHGASGCTSFAATVKVVRVLRIENWHLWTKYQNHLEQVRQDLAKLGLTLAAIEPALPAALRTLPMQRGSLDEKAGEYMLFHGTDCETAVHIALEGFDFRLSRPGYYGQGTYFASQACKSHQYTKTFNGLRTIIVSRVVVGDVAYATKVDRECKRPPVRAGMSRCCDTVVAKPGPMPGHHAGEQTHQEFVIFDKFQAYPEFLVQYVCDDA